MIYQIKRFIKIAKLYNMITMNETTAKIEKSSKSHTGILYLPSNLMLDSAFPFSVPSRVKVRIEGNQLIVENLDRN
jgi:hypothetical protein